MRVCDSCYKTNIPLTLSPNTLKSPTFGGKSRKKSSSPSFQDESVRLCEEELIRAYEERVRKVEEEQDAQRRSAIVEPDANIIILDAILDVNTAQNGPGLPPPPPPPVHEEDLSEN